MFLFVFLAFSVSLSACGRQDTDFLLEEENTREDAESPEKAADGESAEEDDKTAGANPPANTAGASSKENGPAISSVTESPREIFVDVCGAVAKPGVYGMKPDSRVFQAVEAAGGFLPQASGTSINQAQPLSDGQQIYVPTKEEAEAAGINPAAEAEGSGTVPGQESQEAGESSGSGKVNLNTADLAALQTLTGIGEAKAQAILAYREEHGGFSSVEDLMNVPGIKENTFSKIKDKIAVE